MALTRKFLKAMGIEEEKVEQIIEAHIETTEALKEERDRVKEKAQKYDEAQNELSKAKETLTKIGKGETVSKSDYDTLKNEYDDYKAEIAAKNVRTEKESAYRELLRSVGVSEKRLNAVIKVTDIDSVDLDEKGNIKGAEELTESVKKEWSDFIETTTEKGADTATPPANNGGTRMSMAEIYKKDNNGRYVLSTSERQKAIAENLKNQ